MIRTVDQQRLCDKWLKSIPVRNKVINEEEVILVLQRVISKIIHSVCYDEHMITTIEMPILHTLLQYYLQEHSFIESQ